MQDLLGAALQKALQAAWRVAEGCRPSEHCARELYQPSQPRRLLLGSVAHA